MRREEHVDYHLVRDEHLAVHARLEAWARWVRVRPHGWQVAPMFRQYQSKARQWEAPVIHASTSVPEALEVEKVVSLLPEKHRDAIRWCYVWCYGPLQFARQLGVSKDGLMALVDQGRTMVKNRCA